MKDPALQPVRVLQVPEGAPLPIEELIAGGQPTLMPGLVSRWKMVEAGKNSDRAAMDYLRSFYNGRTMQYSYGEPSIRGRPAYTEDYSALNFEVRKDRLDTVLDLIARHREDDQPPTYYIASVPVDSCLPGMRAANDLDFSGSGVDAPPAIWIGTRTIASCHYDAPNNIACCVVGRRRFTLFPPEQIHNLYPGPLDPTPGGQAISAVDFTNPDFEKYPRFRDALACAQYAELEPGDAIFVPSMWWHNVQALSPFNTLVNYWWQSMPDYIPTPMHALYLALWTLRDRPEREKQAWKSVFDYYIFGPTDRANAHLPPAARGLLGKLDEPRARQLRAEMIRKLNR